MRESAYGLPSLRDAIQLRGAMLVFPRARNIARRPLSHRPVQVRVRVVGIQADRLAAIVNGALVVAQPQLRVASGIERQGVRGIDLERLIERLHRLLEILLLGQIAALPVEAIGILRASWERTRPQPVAALRSGAQSRDHAVQTGALPLAACETAGAPEATTRELAVRELVAAEQRQLLVPAADGCDAGAGATGAGAGGAGPDGRFSATTGAGCGCGVVALMSGTLVSIMRCALLNKFAASAGFWPISMARLMSSMAGCGAPVAR